MREDVTRREAMKTALKAGAYAAPVLLAVSAPAAVGAATPPATVDLAVTNSAAPPSGVVPTMTTFTVTVTNNGPVAASSIAVTDVLNATAFVFQSSTASQGMYTAATGIWSIPSLAVGVTATLTITVLALLVGAQTNTATLTGSAPPDANQANNTATATFIGLPPQQFG